MAERNWKEQTVESDSMVWDKVNPNPIEGKFVKVEQDIGPNKSNMYVLETKTGEVKIWGSTVLDDKLIGVPKGTYVKIEYEGKLTSKKGSQYHSYKVFIDMDSMPQDAPAEEDVAELDKDTLNDIFPD